MLLKPTRGFAEGIGTGRGQPLQGGGHEQIGTHRGVKSQRKPDGKEGD